MFLTYLFSSHPVSIETKLHLLEIFAAEGSDEIRRCSVFSTRDSQGQKADLNLRFFWKTGRGVGEAQLRLRSRKALRPLAIDWDVAEKATADEEAFVIESKASRVSIREIASKNESRMVE